MITTSSAFFEVLWPKSTPVRQLKVGYVYIDDSPEEPGVKCLRIEEILSPAILDTSDEDTDTYCKMKMIAIF